MTADEFWNWFVVNAERLHSAEAEVVADHLYEHISSYDDRLGVEVSELDGASAREIIVTGYGDPSTFGSVEELVRHAPSDCMGWKIYALKPPKGFDFLITFDNLELPASSLRFEPLNSSAHPATLGIRVYVPGALIDSANLAETINIVIMTGIGEKRFAIIDNIEVTPQQGSADQSLSIQQLERYIDGNQNE